MLTCTPPAASTCSSILPSICSGESFSGLGNDFSVKKMMDWKNLTIDCVFAKYQMESIFFSYMSILHISPVTLVKAKLGIFLGW
jgi:hypothetical protein